MPTETIEYNGKLFAYIIRSAVEIEGTRFFGSPDDFLQVGYMSLKNDKKLLPHKHNPQNKIITKNQEVLYILSGKVEVSFYDDTEFVGETILSKGDLIVLLSGGHGFKMLEDTKMIEVKQGPYSGRESDKEYLEVKK